MPIERRRKPSAARMAERGFLRASEGQAGTDPPQADWSRSERPRDGMGLAPSRVTLDVRESGPGAAKLRVH
jgi:hypothetical protein